MLNHHYLLGWVMSWVAVVNWRAFIAFGLVPCANLHSVLLRTFNNHVLPVGSLPKLFRSQLPADHRPQKPVLREWQPGACGTALTSSTSLSCDSGIRVLKSSTRQPAKKFAYRIVIWPRSLRGGSSRHYSTNQRSRAARWATWRPTHILHPEGICSEEHGG